MYHETNRQQSLSSPPHTVSQQEYFIQQATGYNLWCMVFGVCVQCSCVEDTEKEVLHRVRSISTVPLPESLASVLYRCPSP